MHRNPGFFECLVRQQARDLMAEDVIHDATGRRGAPPEHPSDPAKCACEIVQMIPSLASLRTRRSNTEWEPSMQCILKPEDKLFQLRPGGIFRRVSAQQPVEIALVDGEPRNPFAL